MGGRRGTYPEWVGEEVHTRSEWGKRYIPGVSGRRGRSLYWAEEEVDPRRCSEEVDPRRRATK